MTRQLSIWKKYPPRLAAELSAYWFALIRAEIERVPDNLPINKKEQTHVRLP